MITDAMLAMAREAAEALMLSSCTITRAGDGERAWNEDTGTYTDPPPATVYSGRCKVQDSGRAVSEAEGGELQVAVSSLELHLPVEAEGSGAVRRGDIAKIDSNPDDPALVGRQFVVQAAHAATAKTARRLPVEAVAGG